MKILFVYPFSKIAPDVYTGTTTNLMRFAEAVSMRHDVIVLSDYIDESYDSISFIGKIKILRMNRYYPWPLGEFYRRLFVLPRIVKKIIREEKIDIIYYLFDPANITYISAFKILNLRIPTIFQADMNPNMYIDWNIHKKLFKRVDAIHSLSNIIKDMLIKENIRDEKIHTIHNTINTAEFKPENKKRFRKIFGIDKDKIIITYVKGREHRAEKFIKFVKPLLDKEYDDIVYTFIGNFNKLSKKFSRGNNNILFTGRVPKDILLDALASTDISLELRGGGWTVLTRPMEYGSSGTALLSPYSKPLEEQFKHNKEVFFSFTHRNDKYFSKKLTTDLIELINNEKTRKKLGKNIRKKIIKNFSYTQTLKKFENMFESLLKQ